MRLSRNIIAISLKVVGMAAFLVLLFGVFAKTTYLFRNAGTDRNNVVGLKSEEKDIDVVYIGGSAASYYWEPLKAYADCGFTSYDLATTSISVESILAYIEYAEKYNKPKLYVVGIRAFQYYTDEADWVGNAGLRNASDSMNLTFIPRYKLLNSYVNNRTLSESEDAVSYFFDIAKYHSNKDNLKSKDAWGYVNNKGYSKFKGCELPPYWAYLEEPSDYKTDDRAELNPSAKKELDKLLDYCDSKDLNVIFVVCPYSITSEHTAIFNAVADEVISRGYDYLNANDYYDEMNIDFAKDFYDVNHVNAYGAEKYTLFLENYITNKYELPDHRMDNNYSDWNEMVEQFNEYTGSTQYIIDSLITEADSFVEQGAEIRETTSFAKWAKYVNDYHYSLLVVGNGQALSACESIDNKLISDLGFDTSSLFEKSSFMTVITDERHNGAGWELPDIEDDMMTVPVGQNLKKCDVVLDNKDGKCSVKIADKEYSRQDAEGLNIVVFDNYYRTVIDSVTLKLQDGEITLTR